MDIGRTVGLPPPIPTAVQVHIYTITVTASQSDGLSTTKTITVTPVGGGKVKVYIYAIDDVNRTRVYHIDSVQKITLAPNPVKSPGVVTLKAKGTGIAGLKVEVFNLAGMKVLEQETAGDTMRFYAVDNRGQPLANGVYLYTVTVKGFDGRTERSRIEKLVILR